MTTIPSDVRDAMAKALTVNMDSVFLEENACVYVDAVIARAAELGWELRRERIGISPMQTARLGAHLTLRQLETRIGISNSYLSQIENNTTGAPRLKQARLIAQALDTTVDALWPEEEGS